MFCSDNAYTLFVNGNQIGSGSSFTRADGYTVALRPTGLNVFAVSGTNVPPGGPAAIIAAILVMYSDGTSETIVTDATWKTLRSAPPAGFQQPGFDDSTWIASNTQGLDGVAPWGQTAIPPALDLTQSNWVWTSEVATGADSAPIAARPFRKTILTPAGKCAVCATVVIAA